MTSTIEWAAHFAADEPAELSPDQAVALLEAFPADAGAAVGVGRGIDATFTVRGSDPPEAFTAAHTLFRLALEAAGIDVWIPARGEVVRADIADRELEESNAPQLAGLAEVGALLEVSKQRVSELRHREDFPPPLAVLASGPVWDRRQMSAFQASRRRSGGRPRAGTTGKADLYVVREDGSHWVFEVKNNHEAVSGVFATQAEAVAHARAYLAELGGGELLVHSSSRNAERVAVTA